MSSSLRIRDEEVSPADAGLTNETRCEGGDTDHAQTRPSHKKEPSHPFCPWPGTQGPCRGLGPTESGRTGKFTLNIVKWPRRESNPRSPSCTSKVSRPLDGGAGYYFFAGRKPAAPQSVFEIASTTSSTSAGSCRFATSGNHVVHSLSVGFTGIMVEFLLSHVASSLTLKVRYIIKTLSLDQ